MFGSLLRRRYSPRGSEQEIPLPACCIGAALCCAANVRFCRRALVGRAVGREIATGDEDQSPPGLIPRAGVLIISDLAARVPNLPAMGLDRWTMTFAQPRPLERCPW